MSMVNSFETSLLQLIFQNSNIANIGDATGLRGSTTAGSLYIGLHTADPTEAAANQAANETSYTNYARVAVARSGAGWSVSGNNASNVAAITFPTCGVTGATVTHFSIGVGSSGATGILFSAALDSSLVVSSGVTPEFAIGALDINAD